MEPVKDINLQNAKSPNEIINQMLASGGFTGKHVAQGVDILEQMCKDPDCAKFLSFTSNIISVGTRGIIKDLIKNKLIDAIITTNGTIGHDLIKLWKGYYHGSFQLDDIELHQRGLNRLGNIIIPNENYGAILEEKLLPIIQKITETKKEWSTKDLIWAIAEALQNHPRIEESIIYWAWKNKIPVFIPGPLDGAVGSQLWMHWQKDKDFRLNLFEDEQAISNIIFDAKKTGALMIGGGISKHHVIWWTQFKDGLDYAVQISTAIESDGSLSGAQTRESISWGFLNEQAKHVSIQADATTILPLMISALMERIK